MNLITRFSGIFLNPRQTTNALAERPLWKDALILIIIFYALFAYFSSPYEMSDTYEITKNSVKLRERLGEERFEQQLDRIQNPSASSILIQNVITKPVFLLIGLLIQCLILLGIGRIFSSEGKYIQILAVFFHSRFIDLILGGVIRFFLTISKKSVFQSTTSLAAFFPKMEVTSIPFMVISQIDFFQLWAYGIVGMGLSAIFKVDLKKGLIISYSIWLIKCLLYIGLGMLGRNYIY